MTLRLRRLDATDADAITRLLGKGAEISARTARIPYPYTVEHAREFLHHVTSSGEFAFAIIVEPGEMLAGCVGITPDRELGYWLGTEFWGRGLATAAVRQILKDDAPRDLGPIRAFVFPDNSTSIRVLEKTGFVCTGQEVRHIPNRNAECIVNRYELSTR